MFHHHSRQDSFFPVTPNPNFFGTRPDLKDVVSDLNRNCRSLSMCPPHSILRCICGHAGEAPLTGDLTAANRRGRLSSLRFNSAKPNKRLPLLLEIRSKSLFHETLKTMGFRKHSKYVSLMSHIFLQLLLRSFGVPYFARCTPPCTPTSAMWGCTEF